ncbi:TraB/GumN family protein [Ostreibacterium oceani]|uniref:TraB family protein n=1 Tax=Ostreibacterium oceani TaxID=2654998 RepID=A0A6N7EUC3_9GAMM|nr:TraB/GumN family protein [Ostreibacterium oceani]MPV85583.1 hypothetical protein [Ostreibacterium oceani]
MKKIGLLLISYLALLSPALSNQIIELKKDEKTLYLFGTIHFAKPDFYPLAPAIAAHLQQSDALALEVDLTDDAQMLELIALMSSKGIDTSREISDWLPAQPLAALNDLFGEDAVNRMTHFRPWMVMMELSTKLASDYGMTELGIDLAIADMASEKQLPVVGLETFSSQIEGFLKIPESEIIDSISQANDTDKNKTQFDNLVDIYQGSPTADELTNQLLSEMREQTPVLFQSFVIDRNQQMTKKIITLNKTNPTLFVAVGALHVYGDDSITNALIKAGYQRQ